MQIGRNAYKRAAIPPAKAGEGTPQAGASPPKQARRSNVPQPDMKLEETESDAAEVLLSFV